MEVDKDTGGVRHNKAENYLPKIPMLSHEKMTSRASEINIGANTLRVLQVGLLCLTTSTPKKLSRRDRPQDRLGS